MRAIRTYDGGTIMVNPASVVVIATTNLVNASALVMQFCPQPFTVRGTPKDVWRVLSGELDEVPEGVEEERPRLVT